MIMKPIYWENHYLVLLDQRELPERRKYITCTNVEMVIDAIKTLAVRGAPLIGVAAAYGMVLIAQEALRNKNFHGYFYKSVNQLKEARPTAVNLSWAIDRMMHVYKTSSFELLYENLLKEAKQIEAEDKMLCENIACQGSNIFRGKKELQLLTHCNAGSLATAGRGTAIGIISKLDELGQVKCVYVDETRPLFQGSRLTALELMENQIPCYLIADNMAADVMKNRKIDAVIVGADRIARNGDVANKIGTYNLAVLCQYHHVPFYVAAPFSTLDKTIEKGEDIPIEERASNEIRCYKGVSMAPSTVNVYNPAFDVTPHELITGIITENGVFTNPFDIKV